MGMQITLQSLVLVSKNNNQILAAVIAHLQLRCYIRSIGQEFLILNFHLQKRVAILTKVALGWPYEIIKHDCHDCSLSSLNASMTPESH